MRAVDHLRGPDPRIRCPAKSAVCALIWLARHPDAHPAQVRRDHLWALQREGWIAVRSGRVNVTNAGLDVAEECEVRA